jgi:site-specific DNA-methyltransferase (adenine-specific)
MDLNESRVIQGDAFQLLKEVPSDSIRLILTDPPYEISRKNNFHTMKVKRTSIDFGAWDYGFDQLGWLPEAVRSLMPGGSIVIWNSFENMGPLSDVLTSLGMSVKRQLVCIRTNPMPRNRDRLFTSSMQNAIWAVKPGAKKPSWVFNRRPDKGYESGIFFYPGQRGWHPTKKPTGLFVELIDILSNPGDWVLDPFAGSGTTGIAAKMRGRNYLCFEMDAEYAKKAQEDINEVTP